MTPAPVNMAHVSLSIKANWDLKEELRVKAQEAGVSWEDLLAICEGQLGTACRMAAHAQLVEMAKNWTADQWRAAHSSFV